MEKEGGAVVLVAVLLLSEFVFASVCSCASVEEELVGFCSVVVAAAGLSLLLPAAEESVVGSVVEEESADGLGLV